jgi:hypothetical protein
MPSEVAANGCEDDDDDTALSSTGRGGVVAVKDLCCGRSPVASVEQDVPRPPGGKLNKGQMKVRKAFFDGVAPDANHTFALTPSPSPVSGGSPLHSPMSTSNLLTLTGEMINSIFGMLSRSEVVALGSACWDMQEHENDVKEGHCALPLSITPDEKHSHGIRLGLITTDPSKTTLYRTPRPGLAVSLFREALDVHTCYWEVRLERFKGPRMLIGVAARQGVKERGTLRKRWAWVYDCNGKFQHDDESVQYGPRCKSGDVVGVLLNNGTHTLTYFVNGESLGVAADARPPPGSHLYPIICLSSLVGDSAVLVRPKRDPLAPQSADRAPRAPLSKTSVLLKALEDDILDPIEDGDDDIMAPLA